MASTTGTTSTTEAAHGERRGGRGRGRGRGAHFGAHQDHDHDHINARGRGRGGNQAGRGPGRGSREGGNRGGRIQDKGKAPAGEAQEAQQAPPALVKPSLVPAATDAEAEEGEVCFICASPVQHLAVAPCNHRTCHICSLRLRALYKTKTCAHCRNESEHVIFTDNPTKNYEEFAQGDFFKTDDHMGIRYENAETYEDTRLLLQYNCPEDSCDVACLGWPDLHRHVKTSHGKVMW
jgi:hypothetical protein